MRRTGEGSGLFGWCLTGHHDRCRPVYTTTAQKSERVCACACHTKEQNTP